MEYDPHSELAICEALQGRIESLEIEAVEAQTELATTSDPEMIAYLKTVIANRKIEQAAMRKNQAAMAERAVRVLAARAAQAIARCTAQA